MSTAPLPASSVLRALAYFVDLAVLVGLAAFSWLFFSSWVSVAIIFVELYFVLVLFRARTGRTPGLFVTKTVAVQVGTNLAPGFRSQLARSTIFGILHLTAIGPLITELLSKNGQDWIDNFVGIMVCDLRPKPVVQTQVDAYGRVTADYSSPYRQADTGPVAQPGLWQAATPTPHAEQSPQSSIPGTESKYADLSQQQPTGALPPIPIESASQPQPTQRPPLPAPLKPTGASVPWVSPVAPPVQQPFPTGLPQGMPELPGGVWITLDSGQRIALNGVAVLGREPQLSSTPGEFAVQVTDPSASISRTHLRIGVDPGGIWVEDAYSANGTFVINEQGRELLPRGRRLYLRSGSQLGLGERTLQLTVSNVSSR